MNLVINFEFNHVLPLFKILLKTTYLHTVSFVLYQAHTLPGNLAGINTYADMFTQ
ncbi:hypothetical protein GPSY_1400 [Paraglaciecola psychrophila 170]|nr:hypothetical protein GPSY_1400 [Paraglaciecola psychrophila 170]